MVIDDQLILVYSRWSGFLLTKEVTNSRVTRVAFVLANPLERTDGDERRSHLAELFHGSQAVLLWRGPQFAFQGGTHHRAVGAAPVFGLAVKTLALHNREEDMKAF